MKNFLSELRSGLESEISDDELLRIFDEVASGDVAATEPPMQMVRRKKNIELTKEIVRAKDKVKEKIEEAKSLSGTRVINRVRKGGQLVQRRKKVSTKKGWTYKAKQRQLVRINALEHLHRSRAAKISINKRITKKAVARIKRQRSMRIRKSYGW